MLYEKSGSIKDIMKSLNMRMARLNELITLSPIDDALKLNTENQKTAEKNRAIYNLAFKYSQRTADLNMKTLFDAIMQQYVPPANHDCDVINTENHKRKQKAFLDEKIDELIKKFVITPAEKEELLQRFNAMVPPAESIENKSITIRKLTIRSEPIEDKFITFRI